ncbi:hypothetical protein [Bradyrhizobium sp. Leo170]|uniref:hypothetical protein n=1 Tax=Bradyrhizobium sp. Leo170 TaxID=1571199 RepID=UPI00102E389A|nr:hypothetical protein [Bradyrhizobium sp. Leo170]
MATSPARRDRLCGHFGSGRLLALGAPSLARLDGNQAPLPQHHAIGSETELQQLVKQVPADIVRLAKLVDDNANVGGAVANGGMLISRWRFGGAVFLRGFMRDFLPGFRLATLVRSRAMGGPPPYLLYRLGYVVVGVGR